MKGHAGKVLRRDSAIERLTNTIAAHEAGVELQLKFWKIRNFQKLQKKLKNFVRKNLKEPKLLLRILRKTEALDRVI